MFEANNGSIEVSTLEEALGKITLLEAEKVALKTGRDFYMGKFADVRDYIQKSIDRDEWTSAELEELFWEELADRLDLDLKLTEEKEVKFTVTYTATITVPKNADIDDLELDIEAYPSVTYRSEDVGEARHDETEVTEY